MMYFVLDYFAGQTGVCNGSTGNILDLLGRALKSLSQMTHIHTHIWTYTKKYPREDYFRI